MKILLFGKNGQVGWELNRTLPSLGEVVAYDRVGADFSAPETLRAIVRENKPDIIVNAAAYTAVDKAEEEEDLVLVINGEAPKVLAEEASKIGALLVHYSTDYVFDGTKTSPYTETDTPNPINAYGRTKLAGEKAIQSSGCDYLIFRTSWVYSSRGHNFLLTILRLASERDELSIVDDQIGSPTSAKLISDVTVSCLASAVRRRECGDSVSGLFHLTATGHTSWFEFAKEIIRSGAGKRVLRITPADVSAIATSDYPTPANRPMNSRLAISKLQQEFDLKVANWRVGLMSCIDELT